MRKTRFMAVLLAVVMLLGTMPAALAASNSAKAGDVSFDDHGVRLAKQASGLNGDWQTQVNLIVESVTAQTPVAVEFVLDGTSSLYMNMNNPDGKTAIASIAEGARKALYGKNAYMGITVFGRDVIRQSESDVTTLPMARVNTSNAVDKDNALLATVVSKLADPNMVGTNIQAGIKAGLDDLQSSVIPDNAIKYLVLVTDGGSYWWNENDVPVNNTINGQSLQNSDAADGGYGTDELAHLSALLNVDPDLMKAKAYSGTGEALPNAVKEIKADPNQYTNFEKGVYHAAKAVDSIPGSVKLLVVSRGYYTAPGNDSVSELSRLAGEFVSYAVGRSINPGNDTNPTVPQPIALGATGVGVTDAVKIITDSASTVIRAGSTITDLMGDSKYDRYSFSDDCKNNRTDADASYNYDLLPQKGFTLTYSKEGTAARSYPGVWNETTKTCTFGDGSTLIWSGAMDGEYIQLTLGKNLEIGEKLVLTYAAELDEHSTAAGNHLTYPNALAYLTPLGSDGSLRFPDPVHTYRVGGGGTTIDPEPVPGGDKPELNTTDHYAYIIGRKDGLVHPEAQITRAEVATIFFRMLTDESRNELWSQSNPYSDITPDMWCNAAISTMTRAGVIEGFQDGTFRPYAPITRAQFATIAVRFFEVTYAGDDKFSDIAGHWAADYINKAAEASIIAGFQDGTFRPNTYITRAQAMTIFNRVLGRAPEKSHLLPGMITWPDNLNTSAWYYATMQEATNSHEYEKVTAEDGTVYEVWTKLLPVRDWAAFEKEWSDSNSAANPGEVISAVVLDQ